MESIGLAEMIVISAACVLSILPLIAGVVTLTVILARRRRKIRWSSSHNWEVEMKRLTRLSPLLCSLAAASVLIGCTPESFSLAGEPVETRQPSTSDLEAVLQVPTRLPDGDSVELEFTLINRSETGLYVLKWFTPLEGLGGEIFRVERDGQAIPYEGPLAYRADPTPEAYVLLGAGESVAAKVDLATAYDFSKAGEYTIEFLSPSISHVAGTEAEMAKTVDDLGPVRMPSNKVAVEIGGSSNSPVRRTLTEAAEMIHDHLRSQKPDLNPDLRVWVEEVPVPEAWERTHVQVFRMVGEAITKDSFLISGDMVLPLGTAFGGHGLTSLEISDLDRDGSPELLFAYSFGSGIHQSRVGMYAPAYGEDRTYEAEIVYLGDLSLFREDVSTMGVRVVERVDATSTLRHLDTLGYLAIEGYNGQTELVLQVSDDLPDDVRQNLIQTATEGQEGMCPSWQSYRNEEYGFGFRYPETWTLVEEPHLVKLRHGTLTLRIAHGWASNPGFRFMDGRTGIPAGDLILRDKVSFLDQPVRVQVLEYEHRDKMVLYGGTDLVEAGDLAFNIWLENVDGASYSELDIPQELQAEAKEILESFDSIDAAGKPPAPSPTPAPLAEKDLITYVNEDYGLAFIYPHGWELEEIPPGQKVPGGASATTLHLTGDTLRLTIQFKRVEEATVLGPSGRPAGEIEDRGPVLAFGREIPKQVLVYEGKVKSVFLGDRFEDLELYVQLDGGVGADTAYEAIEISESAQSAMEAILSSLTRTGGSL